MWNRGRIQISYFYIQIYLALENPCVKYQLHFPSTLQISFLRMPQNFSWTLGISFVFRLEYTNIISNPSANWQSVMFLTCYNIDMYIFPRSCVERMRVILLVRQSLLSYRPQHLGYRFAPNDLCRHILKLKGYIQWVYISFGLHKNILCKSPLSAL